MIGYRLDGFKPALRPRSQAGLGMGSHSAFQSLVGRLIQPVQIADERMDFVQVGSARGVCMLAAGLASTLLVDRQAAGGWSAVGIDTPSPRPLTVAYGGLPEIFPSFFPTGVFPLFLT
jgi:hypothetical protein